MSDAPGTTEPGPRASGTADRSPAGAAQRSTAASPVGASPVAASPAARPLAAGSPTAPARRRRRAVRPGAGEPDPPVDLRSADDSDLGWQDAGRDTNDDRLRRDVPPHW